MRSDYAVYDLALKNQKRAPKNAVLPGIPVLHPVHRTMVEVAVGHKDEVSGQVIGVARIGVEIDHLALGSND